jgi:tRNA pseudouridine13 synthase
MSAATPWRSFADLPRAHGGPAVSGRLRERPEDFQVEEDLGFALDGAGEHALLRVRKTGGNTEWVARRLAAYAGQPVSTVGYAGLKDRHAVTTQWFSVHLAGRPDPDWSALAEPGVEVLEAHRHGRKLRRGALRGNRFRIRLRGVAGDHALLDARLDEVIARGVPNYFGPQRFGNHEGNLHRALALFAGEVGRVDRHLRGLWLSAARGQLFNEVLALRVERQDWDRPVAGDRMQLSGTRSHFAVEAVDEVLLERVRTFDVDPTGPLWGRGEVLTAGEVAVLEQGVAERFGEWTAGLAAEGLRQERRPLRLAVPDLEADFPEAGLLELVFSLPAGAYATAVLRELAQWEGLAD